MRFFVVLGFALCVIILGIYCEDYIVRCGGLSINCICNYHRDSLICTDIQGLPDVEISIPVTMISIIRISGWNIRKYPTKYLSQYSDLTFVKLTKVSQLDCSSVPDKASLTYRLSIPQCEGMYFQYV